jgi:hypothetical protein
MDLSSREVVIENLYVIFTLCAIKLCEFDKVMKKVATTDKNLTLTIKQLGLYAYSTIISVINSYAGIKNNARFELQKQDILFINICSFEAVLCKKRTRHKGTIRVLRNEISKLKTDNKSLLLKISKSKQVSLLLNQAIF